MIIETPRYILMPLTLGDAPAFFQIRGDKKANQYQGWIPSSIEETIKFIHGLKEITFNQKGSWFQLLIKQKDSHTIVGDVAIHFLGDDEICEIGATVKSTFQNQGIATEALEFVINILFEKFNKQKVRASIDPRNIPSIKMVEKLGFIQTAHFPKRFLLRGEFVDDAIYELDKKQWNVR